MKLETNTGSDQAIGSNPVAHNRHACGQNDVAVVKDDEFFTDVDHGPFRAWGICDVTCNTTGVSMAKGDMPPHSEGAFHAHHDTDTALYILAGRVIAEWIDKGRNVHQTKATAGEFIFIPKGVIHRPVNAFNVPMTYIVARGVAHAD
ncbi:MAG: cupin domain-containing protein [Chthoniobacter sp.]|uniref:cupin domain-containing protein n=1 Tax=Chthoniobacter sp. TaxID=2510640 RepID=UPI0032A958B7